MVVYFLGVNNNNIILYDMYLYFSGIRCRYDIINRGTYYLNNIITCKYNT